MAMIRWALLLLFITPSASLQAQEIIQYSQTKETILIGEHLALFTDDSRQITIRDLTDPTKSFLFKSSEERIPNLGSSSAAEWCKFTLLNTSGQNLYLEFRKALLDTLEFYYPDKQGHYQTIQTGSDLPRNTRPIEDNFFIFKIPHSDVPQTFYIRAVSIGNISFPIFLGDAQSMFSKHRDEEFIYGLYIGLILTLALYNLFIFFVARDRNYLFYINYLLINLILYDMSAIGFGGEYIWRDSLLPFSYYTIMDILVALAVLINLIFLSYFLDLQKTLPRVFVINRWMYLTSVAIAIVNLIGLSNHLPFTQIFIIISSLYILSILIISYFQKVRRARFLLIGWSVYVGGIIVYELYLLGILPYNSITLNAIPIGISLEALFFSFALADRIREFRLEKQQAEVEKFQIIEQQKQELERLVYERTLEISAQNEEMQSQNEELSTLQDQLSLQNESLENQNNELIAAWKTIDEQNEALRKYTDDLEAEVKKKASDLVVFNQELIKHNNQLQQFSFITAHNLRSPVARIMGLINLLHLPSVTDEERGHILYQIQKTGFDLDQVIKDLSIILDIKKGISENYEAVYVLPKVEKVKSLLQNEIDRNLIQLSIHIHPDEKVRGLAAYVESIFYNLMSNAIKYRNSDLLSVIKIHAMRDGEFVRITVSDNGLGIDLKNQEGKVFGMYQRFHFHTEGRGLGLHLVKTQVESMGGKISLESVLRKGTTFTILLPAYH